MVPPPVAAGVVFSDAEANVGAQRAVFGLLADVPRGHPADTVVDVVGQVAGEAALAKLAAGAVADATPPPPMLYSA